MRFLKKKTLQSIAVVAICVAGMDKRNVDCECHLKVCTL